MNGTAAAAAADSDEAAGEGAAVTTTTVTTTTTTTTTVTRGAPAAPRALTSRTLDFWLLGGASVVVWAMAKAGGLFDNHWAMHHHFENLLAISGTAALVCNYPHFMASYRLAYGQGGRYVLRHWYQLILVPLLLVGLLAAGVGMMRWRGLDHGAFAAMHAALTKIGLQTTLGQAQSTGREILGLLLNLMYFTVGWHYSKQTYGAMMVQGAFDGYRLDDRQKRILRWSSHAVWFSSWVTLNIHVPKGVGAVDFHGVWYSQIGFPAWMRFVVYGMWLAGLAAVLVGVFYKQWRATGALPSANFVIPYLAFTVWWNPLLVQEQFFYNLVPFFHSLQYLAFVYKVEKVRLHHEKPAGEAAFRGAAYAIILVVAGFLAFELVPNELDNWRGTYALYGAWLFFVCAQIFINVHHYFIDNVIWRFTNKHVKDYLIA